MSWFCAHIFFADDTNLFYKGNKMKCLVKIIDGELEKYITMVKNK